MTTTTIWIHLYQKWASKNFCQRCKPHSCFWERKEFLWRLLVGVPKNVFCLVDGTNMLGELKLCPAANDASPESLGQEALYVGISRSVKEKCCLGFCASFHAHALQSALMSSCSLTILHTLLIFFTTSMASCSLVSFTFLVMNTLPPLWWPPMYFNQGSHFQIIVPASKGYKTQESHIVLTISENAVC